MNLRFPEIFGLMLLGATVCSFGMPRGASQRIATTFQFLYAPVTGPIQWMTGSTSPTPADVPILTGVTDEVARLRAEKLDIQVEAERLRGQLETLRHRAAQHERIGEGLRDRAVAVKVIGPDASGRDILRLSGSSSELVIDEGAPVVTESAMVGRVAGIGAGNQTSVRLITDKGFRLLAVFGRYAASEAGARLEILALPETVVEGAGKGTMRIDSLRKPDIDQAGLRVNDLVLLSDVKSTDWPIEVHGYRVGVVKSISERLETPGVAEVIVTPEVDLFHLRDLWIIGKKE